MALPLKAYLVSVTLVLKWQNARPDYGCRSNLLEATLIKEGNAKNGSHEFPEMLLEKCWDLGKNETGFAIATCGD